MQHSMCEIGPLPAAPWDYAITFDVTNHEVYQKITQLLLTFQLLRMFNERFIMFRFGCEEEVEITDVMLTLKAQSSTKSKLTHIREISIEHTTRLYEPHFPM